MPFLFDITHEISAFLFDITNKILLSGPKYIHNSQFQLLNLK